MNVRPHLVGTPIPHADQVVTSLLWTTTDGLRHPSGRRNVPTNPCLLQPIQFRFPASGQRIRALLKAIGCVRTRSPDDARHLYAHAL